MGRPSCKTPELIEKFLSLVEDGRSINTICKDESMPSRETIRKWMRDDTEFVAKYARAREVSADNLAEEIVDIADDKELDPHDKRVRIDARRWVAGKMKPKKYGDKLDMNLSGSLEHVSDQRLTETLGGLLAKCQLRLGYPDTSREDDGNRGDSGNGTPQSAS